MVLLRSRAVLPRHTAVPSLALDDPAAYPTLEACAGTPIVAGNRLELLLNGQEIFPARLAVIAAAEGSITFAPYYYARSAIGHQLAEALAARSRAGVRVNVLLDRIGALGIPREYVQTMRRAGCRVAMFRPLRQALRSGRINNRNHRRILVVDGRLGITGGSGIGPRWKGDGRTAEHWRDTDVRVEGPVVASLQAVFARDWLEATGEVLGGVSYFPGVGHRGNVVARSSPRPRPSATWRSTRCSCSPSPRPGARSPSPTPTSCRTRC